MASFTLAAPSRRCCCPSVVVSRRPSAAALPRRQARSRAASTDEAVTTVQRETPASAQADPAAAFVAASMRLKDLLEDASWDTEEELKHEVGGYSPEMKLTLFTNLGSVLTLIAFASSWLFGEDPFGGLTLQGKSMDAALLGVGYALPLVVCSLASRLRPVSAAFPVLEDLHASQMVAVQPIVEGLNPSQLLILASVTTIPSIFLLLPSMHGAMMVLGQIMMDHASLLQPLGVALPASLQQEVAVLVPAVISSYIAAWAVTRQLAVKERQAQAIRDAVTNADRYFLHATAEQMADSPAEDSNCSKTLASKSREASEAFKTVAIVWLLMKRKVAQLAFVLTGTNVSYYGIIWAQAGDLATPMAAALVATLVELGLVQHGALMGQQRRRQQQQQR